METKLAISRNIMKMENVNLSKNVCFYCLQKLTADIYQGMQNDDDDDDVRILGSNNAHLCLAMLKELLASREDVFRMECFEQLLLFAKVIIESTLKALKRASIKVYYYDVYFQQESLDFVLKLLRSMIKDVNLKSSYPAYDMLNDLVFPLNYLYLNHFDMEVKTLTLDLVKSISAFVKSQSQDDRSVATPRSSSLRGSRAFETRPGTGRSAKVTLCSRSSCSALGGRSYRRVVKDKKKSPNSVCCCDEVGSCHFPMPLPSKSMNSGLRDETRPNKSKSVRFSDVISTM